MALVTAQFGIHNGVINHGGQVADRHRAGRVRGFNSPLWNESLPGFLRRHGFKTASVGLFASRHGAWKFNACFEEVYNAPWYNAENLTPNGGLSIYVKRLERTGRNWAVAELKRRHPREFG